MPPDAQLMQLVSGAFVSAAVYSAAKLGIADLLADGPMTSAKLAEETGTDELSLYRLLRSLASVGAFVEVEAIGAAQHERLRQKEERLGIRAAP